MDKFVHHDINEFQTLKLHEHTFEINNVDVFSTLFNLFHFPYKDVAS